ncbi:MAG: hypothetical protein M9938_01050 [Solirubrobacterales bacterium]|nr:hypothetical protein [Solirubrobacterales bacterium]
MEEKSAGRTRLPAALLFAVPVVLILVAALGLLTADSAGAARYTVLECGWYVGQDANWIDTSDSKFMRSSYCQPPRSNDAFDGVHLTSETRNGAASVGGARFASWRWNAPSGVTITTVHGHRWQVVRDGFEHRLGTVSSRGFEPFLNLATTDTARRDFRQNDLPAGTTAFESRLLCARAESKRCSAEKSSLAGVRALTITMDDPSAPSATVSGELTGEGWLRGVRNLGWTGRDRGSGLRYSETAIDGSVRARTENRCQTVVVGGLTRGSRMQPCELSATGTHTVNTATLSDGPHQLRHCGIDFAGASGCTAVRTVRTDNTAPGAPRDLIVTGGDGWRRSNGFSLAWTLPDQGPAAPIVASRLRITGPDGRDGGVLPGSAPNGATGLNLPAPGEYRVRAWLVDAAGNEREDASAGATLRFDDLPPTGYFRELDQARPELLQVPVADQHSGVAAGTISVRPVKGGEWRDLPTGLTGPADSRELTARIPSEDLPPGAWVAQATITDVAGNQTVTSRRGNGSTVTFRTPLKVTSTINARLVGSRGSGPMLRVPYGGRASLSGRLSSGGRGLEGQSVRVTELPRSGSRQRPLRRLATTGTDGWFRVWLRRGTSRRVTVSFAGSERFESSSAGPFALRVRGGLSFRAVPRRLRTGRRIQFRGRVRARHARRPATGNLVAVQYLERASGTWRPVLVARTDRHGIYRAGYRFRYIEGVAKIRLRAVLLPSPWFPYDQTISRPVVVRVKG